MSATQKEQPIVVSLSGAARMLDCHRNSVRRLIEAGHLVPVMVGTMRRIPVAQIEALVAAPPPRVRIPRRKQREAAA